MDGWNLSASRHGFEDHLGQGPATGALGLTVGPSLLQGLPEGQTLRELLHQPAIYLPETAWMRVQRMTDDIDNYRSAALLMREHGEDAVIEAAMRADALLDKGDMDGRAVWMRIIAAIKELKATEPEGVVH